jgi:acyl carrier protein
LERDGLAVADSAEILQQLQAVFRDCFDDDDLVLTPELTAADVPGWDSLRHVMLMVAVEQRFGVRFSVQELPELKNVGDLAAMIAAKQKR